MASVLDVAAYILERRGKMTTMKLQKLCYYSQAWNLAWDEKPIFNEPIQAWANGPVVYELFDQHRGQFEVTPGGIQGNVASLSEDDLGTIDAVLDAYGNLTGQDLSDMTHSERPWIEARRGLSDGAFGNVPVDLDVMQDYYGGIDSASQ